MRRLAFELVTMPSVIFYIFFNLIFKYFPFPNDKKLIAKYINQHSDIQGHCDGLIFKQMNI